MHLFSLSKFRSILHACIGVFLGLIPLACASKPVESPIPTDTQSASKPDWELVWSDEFEGAAGSAIASTNWSFDLGDGCAVGNCGWGNREKEYYTDTDENIVLNGNSQLEITARIAPEDLVCYYGACKYTSARIRTNGKVESLYGRIEASIKLPAGQGLWPAFWMLGNDIHSVSWPKCGEIDIMEFRGSKPTASSSAMHGPGYSGNTPFAHGFKLSNGSFSDTFHLFAVEWEPDQARFYVDDELHYTVTKAMVEPHGKWVFDHPFFIILNLAVGGHFDGDPLSDSIFPATMAVDYVRVYSPPAKEQPSAVK